MPGKAGIEPGLLDELLDLPTRERQARSLRDKGLLDAGGLGRLLDAAEGLLNSDPGKSRRLAGLCVDVADEASAPAALPRASYLIAGTHSMVGDFAEDLRFTEAAYRGYLDLGMTMEALRTRVGKMVALFELGRYGEALDTGNAVLNALEGRGEIEASPTQREADLLTALVYQNRGTCYAHMGRYDEALDAFAVAEDRYRAVQAIGRLGEITDNRGIVLRYLGRGNEALEAHEAAAAIFEDANLTLSYALALGNIGETYSQLGSYTSSLDAFERARRLLSSLDAPVDEHDTLLGIASTYLALNLYPEALAAYREAKGLVENDDLRFERASGLWAMGATLIACSRLDEAEEVLGKAAASFAALNNTPMLSSVMLEQASLLAERGNRMEALEKAGHALEIVSSGDWPVQQIYARLRLADLSLEVEDSEPHLLAAQQLANRLALPQLRYRLNERLGHLRRLQGRSDEAREFLEKAVDEIERQRGAVLQDAMRVSFLRDKTAAFADLLLLHLDRQDDGGAMDAFVIAERAKSRALVDLLTGVVAENTPAASSDSGLRARIQTLRADLNGVYGGLLGGLENDEHHVPVRDLHERAVELEQEIGRLRLQVSAVGRKPDPFGEPMLQDEIQNQLPPDVPLLAYHVAEGEVMAFVYAGERVRFVRRLSTADRVRRLLHRLDIQWDRFRAGRGFTRRHTATLERSARHVLAALYAELVAPLETLLEQAATVTGGTGAVPELAILPHGPLHRVPFHALFDGDGYMVERFAISYAPSATVYALCQQRSPLNSGLALVFGVEDPSIPAATIEARAVSERIIGAEVRLGEEATVATLQEDAPRCEVLHLACHGLFRADNPMFSSLKLGDGWLTAADALSLDLPGMLVTLSACESGRGEVIGGDEVLGLTRAFLGAGAATLVVSLWVVQDETTAALMETWYGLMDDGTGRAAALRSAQLAVKERNPHPYYWAPFVLIGKR